MRRLFNTAASMTASPWTTGRSAGKDAGITGADLAFKQCDAVFYEALEAHGSPLERPAVRASVEKQRFDQQPHSGNRPHQTLEIAARRVVGPILELVLDR